MGNQFEITFSVQDKSLFFSFFILGNFIGPLVFKHTLFSNFLTLLISTSFGSCVGLPSENVDGFLNFASFFSCFTLLSLDFLFLIKHPKLSINLFFNNVLFNFVLFIHQLFFSFDLATCNHEIGLFFSQFICFHFEFSV
jgi:hypothetical protein